jgi:RNA polymerase sigma factor (sigma-70 family)
MTDDTLRKAKLGDQAALNLLLETHKQLAYSVAFKYIRDHADAADIVQEAFIKVFLNIHKFKSEARFSTWLFKIVYHESIKYLQSKKQHQGLDEAAYMATEEEKPEPAKLTEVKKAMSSLTEKEYTMITLFYLGEQDIKEIAVITQESKDNIKVILHRARKKLSAYFNKTKE